MWGFVKRGEYLLSGRELRAMLSSTVVIPLDTRGPRSQTKEFVPRSRNYSEAGPGLAPGRLVPDAPSLYCLPLSGATTISSTVTLSVGNRTLISRNHVSRSPDTARREKHQQVGFRMNAAADYLSGHSLTM